MKRIVSVILVTAIILLNANAFASASSFKIEIIEGKSDKTIAKPGETITIEAYKDPINPFFAWAVVEGEVELSDHSSSKTTFIMPSHDVKIEAVFTMKPSTVLVQLIGDVEQIFNKAGIAISEKMESISKEARELYNNQNDEKRAYELSNEYISEIKSIQSNNKKQLDLVTVTYSDPEDDLKLLSSSANIYLDQLFAASDIVLATSIKNAKELSKEAFDKLKSDYDFVIEKAKVLYDQIKDKSKEIADELKVEIDKLETKFKNSEEYDEIKSAVDELKLKLAEFISKAGKEVKDAEVIKIISEVKDALMNKFEELKSTDKKSVLYKHFMDGIGIRFEQERPLTRAEGAQLIANILEEEGYKLKQDHFYSDVDKDKWYYDAINMVTDAGIFEGHNNKFNPQKELSRAEWITVLTRFVGLDPVEEADIQLINGNHWAKKYIYAAKKAGLIDALKLDLFDESIPITRAEVAAISNKAFGRTINDSIKKAVDEKGSRFMDNYKDSNFYYEIELATNDWLVEDGVWKMYDAFDDKHDSVAGFR